MSIPHPRPGRRAERQELRPGSGVPGSKNPPGIAATADCPGAWARPNTDRRFAANCRGVPPNSPLGRGAAQAPRRRRRVPKTRVRERPYEKIGSSIDYKGHRSIISRWLGACLTNDRRHEGAPHRADFCDRYATHSGYYVSETIAEICRWGAAAVGASLVRQAPRDQNGFCLEFKHVHLPLRINFSMSARLGAEGCAPSRVTESAAAALANRTASKTALPSASATLSAPLNMSPAAVESTVLTLKPGTSRWPLASARNAPRSPKVRTTMPTPRERSFEQAFAAAAASVTLMPVSSSASVSLGVRMEIRSSSELGSGRAGAGLRMTGTPAFTASSTAAVTVTSGVSNCATSNA